MPYESYNAYRLVAKNTPKEAYLDYQETFQNDRFDDASTFDTITVDGQSTDVRIVDVKSSLLGNPTISFVKELLFRPNTVRRRGSYAVIDGQNWILFDFKEGLTPKANIRLCNQTLTIQTGVTEVLIGTDSMNRPVYDKTYVTKSWPCVADTKALMRDNPLNSPINLPDGTLSIIVQYTTEIVESEDTQFTMWGQQYKIVNINYEYVMNNEGPMIITAQRVVK